MLAYTGQVTTAVVFNYVGQDIYAKFLQFLISTLVDTACVEK